MLGSSMPDDKHEVSAEVRARITDDPWARALGVEYLEVRRGYCQVALSLGPHMVNYLRQPHGSVVFTLADIAFGAACNSHGEPAVALSMAVNFLAAPAAGSRLTAECRERRQGRRAGFYEITVIDEAGTVIATLQCVAHRTARRTP